MAGNHDLLTASDGSPPIAASQLLSPATDSTAQASSSSPSPTSISSPGNPSIFAESPSSMVPIPESPSDDLGSAPLPALSEHLRDELGGAFVLLFNTVTQMSNIKGQSCDPTAVSEISALIDGLKDVTYESLGGPVADDDPELDMYFRNPMDLPRPASAGDGIMPGLGPTEELEEILRDAVPKFAVAAAKAKKIPEKVQDAAVIDEFSDFSFILKSVSGKFQAAWKHVCRLRGKGVLDSEGSVPTSENVLPVGLARELNVALDQLTAAFYGLLAVARMERLAILEDFGDGGYRDDAARCGAILNFLLTLFGRSPMAEDLASSSSEAAAAVPLDAVSYLAQLEKVLDFSFQAVCSVGQGLEKVKTWNIAIPIICERLKKTAFPLWVLRQLMRRLAIAAR